MSDGGVVVVHDVEEEAFSGVHSRGTEDFPDSPIKGGGFAKRGSMKGSEHNHVEGSCGDHGGEVIFIPASLSRAGTAEKVGPATDHHHINVGIVGKPPFVMRRSRSARANSLPWLLHPRRLLLLFATL
ncbi:hypothetical protein MLD38_036882 [Melastoma candidum]|uniref:Uncharacterized protein n=1 Tax=Melastoma candidum TaxID=119954 RepID=A0ACB9LM86_9MYRT|nr:hypothetical protein MLD38_036882 [Melastoma candidum]